MTSKQLHTIALEDFAVGGAKLLKEKGREIAVFRISDKEVFAVDNRCPHEGYPLIKGTVRDCVLTCPWHNFKFELQSGKCIKGSENVQTYPVRFLENQVEVDISIPDAALQREKINHSLHEGLWEHRNGQVARDVVRLLQLGTAPENIIAEAAKFDSTYAEWGTSHVLPVALDVLEYLDRYPGLSAVYPIMQVMELASEGYHHYPPRRVGAAIKFEGEGPDFEARLHRAIEDEELELAEGLFRGALEGGWQKEHVQRFFFEVVSLHFLGYGHALIYCVKIFEFLELTGWVYATDILSSFLVRLINWTREDLLPEWNWFREKLKQEEIHFPKWHELTRNNLSWEREHFVKELVWGKRADALDALVRVLEAGVPLPDLVDALSEGAAERILRFKISIDRSNEIQNGWLAITHIATYVNALRSAVRRFDQPDIFRLFFFAIRFINQGKALDGDFELSSLKKRTCESEEEYVSQIELALVAHDWKKALSYTKGYLREFGEASLLKNACMDFVFKDVLVRPIVVAHWIKMTVALFGEYQVSNGPAREKHLLALIRFGSSPLRERWISRVSFEAIQFLEHGRVPKDLM